MEHVARNELLPFNDDDESDESDYGSDSDTNRNVDEEFVINELFKNFRLNESSWNPNNVHVASSSAKLEEIDGQTPSMLQTGLKKSKLETWTRRVNVTPTRIISHHPTSSQAWAS